MKVLLIIPAYNEEENIEKVINNLETNFPEYDYLIVNDGSTDDSLKILRENNFDHLNLPINLGLAGAVKAGYKYAYEQAYDVAIQYDGDGQHLPEYIHQLINEIKNGADIVIGSRYVTKKKPFNPRMIGSRLLTTLIFLTTGKVVKDPTSGMRAIDKKLIKEFAMDMNYPPEPDTIAYQLKKGAKISEVQVEMAEREAGTSYLNITNSIKYMTRMIVSIVFVQRFRK